MKRTPLYSCHVAADAKLVEFAGWEMPVQYEGVIAEHHAVRNACGLFDVSHMANFAFAGRAGREAVGRLLTNDITDLAPGHTRYNLVCDEAGGTLDDVMVSCHAPDYLTMVANAANHDKLTAHFADHLPFDTWQNDTDALALLALQGPASAGILKNLGVRAQTADGELPPRGQHTRAVIGDLAVHLHHTGYSGELGFELAVAGVHAAELWERLLEAGKLHGLRPAGLGARDTLRLEAGLPLYGHELSEDISPIEAGLRRFVDLGGRDYLGGEALRRQAAEGPAREPIGLRLLGRGVPRADQPVSRDGETLGVVTSGNHSPTLKCGIALALVKGGATKIGDTLAIEIRDRAISAERVKLPFYRRPQRPSMKT
ncbi:MAG: glycine cleavage system aminomethyltransferase GcvT [Nitrospirota bacterium]|jgi:aminomethyltransferase